MPDAVDRLTRFCTSQCISHGVLESFMPAQVSACLPGKMRAHTGAGRVLARVSPHLPRGEACRSPGGSVVA